MTNSPSRAARPRNPGTLSVGEALKKYGITGSTIAGGHGTTANQADIAPGTRIGRYQPLRSHAGE